MNADFPGRNNYLHRPLIMTPVTSSNEQLIMSIVDAQPESVIWFKPVWSFSINKAAPPSDFEVQYCNKKACEFLQSSKEMLIGQHLLQTAILDDASKQLIFNQCLKVWETGEQVQGTYYNEKLERYFNVLRSKVLDGVISVTRDYTEIILAEQQLKKQADLLNSILDSSTNGVFACEAIRDVKGTIVDLKFLKANKRFEELSGKKEEELLNTTFLKAFPKASEYFHLNCCVIETGIPVRKVSHYQDGELEAWYDLSLTKLWEDGLVVTSNDITQSVKNKLELEASAQYLQNAIDSSQTGITVIVPVFEGDEIIDFRYKVVNYTFSKYIGKMPQQMAGQLLSSLFPLYKAQGTFDRYKKLYQTGEPQRFDLHYVKDGFDVWVDILAKKQGNEIFVTFHDYTPLKKAQLQLEAMVKDLKHTNSNLEDFAYAASHDMQEPLRKIHFFADKLKNNYSHLYDEEGKKMFERMEAATQRMRDLIDDLLSYSQVNLKEKVTSEVDLNEILQEVISDMEATIHQKKAQFTYDVLPVIKGDKSQLRQLFQNLISNAVKYSHEERTPFVSIRKTEVTGRDSGFSMLTERFNETFYLFEVTDNGIGFDQENAEKIFNIFQRLHGKTEYSGTGIGLAIAKKVVDNHKGYIEAKSKPGEGSVFRVLLPLQKAGTMA